jgi:hypothetical protein
MNDRNLDQIIDAWMDLGPTAAPHRVADAARLEVRFTRQTAIPMWWPPRRFPVMNAYLKVALATAAVIVAAVLGSNLLVGPNVGGLRGVDGHTASPSPSPEARRLPAARTVLDGGRYLVAGSSWTRRPFTVEVPDGWSTENGFIANRHGNWDAGQVVFTTWVVDSVYADSCNWQGTLVDVITAADIAGALSAQRGHETVGPTSVMVDGHRAQRFEFSVTDDFDAAACDQGFLRLWPDPGQDETGGLPIGPGQRMTVDVVDDDGVAVVLIRAVMPEAPPADVALLDAMGASVDFPR